MTAMGHSLPKWGVCPTVRFPPIATKLRTSLEVRSVPRQTCGAVIELLFDNSGSAGHETGGDLKTEFFCARQVDDQLEADLLEIRHVGRLGAM